MSAVAPRWLGESQGPSKLRAVLHQLSIHTADLDADAWRLGGGLLTSYLEIPVSTIYSQKFRLL